MINPSDESSILEEMISLKLAGRDVLTRNQFLMSSRNPTNDHRPNERQGTTVTEFITAEKYKIWDKYGLTKDDWKQLCDKYKSELAGV